MKDVNDMKISIKHNSLQYLVLKSINCSLQQIMDAAVKTNLAFANFLLIQFCSFHPNNLTGS